MKWRYEHCKICGREQRLAWSVKDEVWKKVMGNWNRVACLECFLKKADEKKINITKTDFNFLGWIGYYVDGDTIIDESVKKS